MKKKMMFMFCVCLFLSFVGSSCFDTDVPNSTGNPPPATNLSGILLGTGNSGDSWTLNYPYLEYSNTTYRGAITGVTSFSSDPDSICIVSDEKTVWKRSGYINSTWGFNVFESNQILITDIINIPSSFNNGIVIGQTSAADYGMVAMTTDDGYTWIQNTLSTTLQLRGLRALDFDNDMRGMIIPEAPQDSTYKTFDGGYTWIASAPVPGTYYKNDISYYESNFETHPVVCGNFGSIYRINFPFDTNWIGTVSSTSQNLNSIDFSGLVGVIVGDRGTILRSEDGGENWSVIQSGVTNNLKKIQFHLNLCMAIGDNVILKSTDYGLTWLVVRNEPKEYYHDLYLFQPYGIVVGAKQD